MLRRRYVVASIALALSILTATPAAATAQRTFVSFTGTANPSCSRTAPCRQFADAITATNVGGEIIVLDSSGYGPVTINKSLSIIAPPGIYAGISVFSGNGVTVNAPGAIVVLRGLSINGQGGANGILVQQAARVRIENCVISNMALEGVYHHADNAEVIVLDTISRDNGDGGFALVASNATIVLDHVRGEHNVNVGFYMAPTPGSSSARAEIADSLFAENGGNGIWADSVGGATSFIGLARSVVSGNVQAGFYANAAAGGARINVTLTRNSFHSQNGALGVRLLGFLPAFISAFASDNAVSRDSVIFVGGSGSELHATGNTGGALFCDAGATLNSFGNNNVGATTATGGCTVNSVPGS